MAARRVKLAALRPEDSDRLYEWINDRELVVLNAPFEPVSRADHDRWFASIQRRPDVAIFGIRLSRDDRLIGTCQLNEIDRERAKCRLQIRIGEKAEWGKGYGTEAVGELLSYAFGPLDMQEVGLHVFADNRRAVRAYEKCGFEVDRIVHEGAVVEGMPKDLIEMTVRSERTAADGE